MDDPLAILQSERSQFRACRTVIRVKNATNTQTFRDLDEHRGVFDIDDLPGWRLSDVQHKPKDVRVGLEEMDEAGGNERIHKSVELGLANPILIQFAPFVADHGDLEPVPELELSGVRFRLREHEALKLSPGERSLWQKTTQPKYSSSVSFPSW
jgi:hypothetical protein